MNAKEFREIQSELGLTRHQMAERLGGVHPNSVDRWRYGLRSISRPNVRILEGLLAEKRRKKKEKP